MKKGTIPTTNTMMGIIPYSALSKFTASLFAVAVELGLGLPLEDDT